jgi:hypothetical protein
MKVEDEEKELPSGENTEGQRDEKITGRRKSKAVFSGVLTSIFS